MGQPQNRSSGWKPSGGKHPNLSGTLPAQTCFSQGRPGHCLPRSRRTPFPQQHRARFAASSDACYNTQPRNGAADKAFPQLLSYSTPEPCRHGQARLPSSRGARWQFAAAAPCEMPALGCRRRGHCEHPRTSRSSRPQSNLQTLIKPQPLHEAGWEMMQNVTWILMQLTPLKPTQHKPPRCSTGN